MRGIIRLTVTADLATERTISLANPLTYLGHCDNCPDVCGVALVGEDAIPGSHRGSTERPPSVNEYHHPVAPQAALW